MANDGRSRLSGSSLQITSCISYCTEPALAVTRTGKFGCNTRSTASTSSHSIKRGCLISFGHGTEAAKETVNYHWALKRRKQNSRSVHANVVEARRATHCHSVSWPNAAQQLVTSISSARSGADYTLWDDSGGQSAKCYILCAGRADKAERRLRSLQWLELPYKLWTRGVDNTG
jgi:hypothetical protein